MDRQKAYMGSVELCVSLVGTLVSWGRERAQSFENTKGGGDAQGGLEGHGKIVLHTEFWQVILKTSLPVQELFLEKRKLLNTLFTSNWVHMDKLLVVATKLSPLVICTGVPHNAMPLEPPGSKYHSPVQLGTLGIEI